MKKQLFIILCLIGLTFPSFSQEEINKNSNQIAGLKFGIGLEGALPSGALKDVANYKYGGGLSIRFSKGIAQNLDLVLTSGALGFVPEDLNNATIDTKASIFIPLKLGARLMLGNHFYVMADGGVMFTKIYQATSVNMNNATATDGFVNGSTFTFAPGLGLKFGAFNFGARYEMLSDINGGKTVVLPTQKISTEKKGSFIGLRIGFDF
jgi:hypothetical protein